MTDQLDTLLSETRRFPPPADFAARAVAQPGIYERAAKDPEAFWAEEARAPRLDRRRGRAVLEWKPPHAKWFVGGTLNVCGQLRRPAPRAARGATRPRSSGKASRATAATLTYWDLSPRGEQFANVAQAGSA